ncbi:RNA-directed DNA polymerase, eukaryota, reverse transcriptase zinc-binding domain protein [Tanacetum coccineum]
MATNPNDVRLTILMALQEAHDEEACLEEQILILMHRFADRFTNRRPEINRLMTLDDHPLIEYGRYALGYMTGMDIKKATYLKSVRDELLRSMKEKRQLIKNYKEIRSKSKVDFIKDEAGISYEGDAVNNQFVKHFEKFFRKVYHTSSIDKSIFKRSLSNEEDMSMIGDVTDKEIKEAMHEVSTHSKVSEFRLISCCNVIYKCISKILTNRIKGGLDKVVHINQSAFIPRRHIQDNILIAQELLRGYNRKNGPKRCAMQIDIQKAYDTTHGYFKGGRGLRHGDPMSPYLFTLVMEVFSLIMEKNIKESNCFGYHYGCKELKLSHMCFADDLLVLCKGNRESIEVIKKSLEEFSKVSGLVPNLGKSIIFFGSINERDKSDLLHVLPFKCGKLPVRYLGVPLLAKKLGVSDYKVLCDKVDERINNWRNKTLSYAGRIQLIASVLSSMQHDSARRKARVYWKVVCRPKDQGGMGMKSLKNGMRSIWDVNMDKSDSWGWKSMLKIRDDIKNHVWYDIGEGRLSNKDNKVLWVTNVGDKVRFTTKQAWEDLRDNWPLVNWRHVVWFNQIIPRQAFIMWMAVHDKLLTQDKIERWKQNDDLKCGFCKQCGDSDVVHSMVGRCGKNNIGNVVDKLILETSVYFIWQERNFRLFKNESRSEDVLINLIYDSVRSKLMTVRVKKTSRTDVIAKKWNLQWNNQYLSAA